MLARTEKALHAGNVAAAFAVVATAADLSISGGAMTTFSAALSGMSLFKKADRSTQSLTQTIARTLDEAVATSGLAGGRRRIAVQMLNEYPPDATEMAAGNMDAETVAERVRDRIRTSALDPAHKTDRALNDFTPILTQALTVALADPDPQTAMLTELLRRSDAAGQSDRLRDEGITEKAIIRLAQRIAGETEDLGQAWLELQNAMDIAVRVQEEGRVTSNHGDFVDEVLRRVADLAKDGEYASAGDEIDAALADEAAAHDARMVRLLDSGTEVALLAGDTARAADLLVRKADLEAGARATFEALRALWMGQYEEGRGKGVNLQAELSIDLARIVLARAGDGNERSSAGNYLGASLQTLGERESGTECLEAAVAAYNAALEERTRDRVPMDWAAIQTNLGNALAAIGERESGTARLEAAVAVYEAALEEIARDRMPLQWANTQMNLGNAFSILGERENGTARLKAAVAAYEFALEERTRDRVPMDWAMTQMNLGIAFFALGEPEGGTERIEAAVAAFEAALEERTRDRVPLDWAMTQMNLGNALQTLGKRESGTGRLEAAAAAYEAALEERTRDRVPLDWAMTQNNLAHVEVAFFDKTQDAVHLDRAMAHVMAAREVFEEAGASRYIAMANGIIAAIQSRRSPAG